MIKKKKSPTWLKICSGLLLLVILLVIAFVIYGSTPARPMAEALTALKPGDVNVVDSRNWLSFLPNQPRSTALIIYPGARVDYRAYAPEARAIAENGYPVFLVQMPLNLAVLNPEAAGPIIKAHPEIIHWAIGGHSLGGVMAASFVYDHPDLVGGLVLWASYPASSNNLKNYQTAVISISGSLDGLSTPEKISASASLLPANTIWVIIKGGNHAGFGWYGPQSGDNPSQISRLEQQNQIVAATVELLKALK